MAAISVPRMRPAEASPAHESRVAQGAFAQLVSKFEGLISTSGGRQLPVPFSRSLPLSHSSSNIFSNLKTVPPQDTSALGEYIRRNDSICYISDLSPGDSTPNSERRPTCIRIPSITSSEMENIPNTELYLCSRHKSVAERRKAFESSDGTSSAWTSTRASTDAGHPMKLTHSISWQTIRTHSSFNKYLNEDTSSNSSSGSTVTAEGHHPNDVNNRRRSIFQHSNQAFTSIAGPRSRMKTTESLNSQNLKKEMSPLSATSRSGWMKLDNKAGEFFPSLKSNNTSSHTLSLLPDKQKFKENTASSPSQKSVTGFKMKTNAGAPQSKIASLRQIFDRPKSETSSPTISAKTRRRVATPVNVIPTPRKPRRLQKSATVQMLGSMDSLKIETKNCHVTSPITNSKSETLSTPTTSVGKKDSPLKEKIGLFESLSRKSRDSSPSSTKSKKIHAGNAFLRNYKRTVSEVKKSLQMKGALRRLSASLRTSSEDSADARDVKVQASVKPKDAWWVGRDQTVTKKGHSSKITSHVLDVQRPTVPAMVGEHLKKKDTAPKEGSSASQSPTRTPKRLSLADQSSSAAGESGKRLSGKTYHKNDSKSNIPSPHSNAYGNSLFAVKLNARPRPLSPFRTHPMNGTAGSRALFRRQISRSGGPFVANAYCKLEQPKPVRAGEMKRLVSLCKDKVARRVSAGVNE